MAWQAKLIGIGASAEKVIASFSYYDDQAANDPKTGQPPVVWTESFSFDPTWTSAQMQSAVVARGTQVKTAKVRADALTVQFPAQTTIIAIP